MISEDLWKKKRTEQKNLRVIRLIALSDVSQWLSCTVADVGTTSLNVWNKKDDIFGCAVSVVAHGESNSRAQC